MLFENFFRKISDLLPPDVLLNMDALAQLNPDKFYVENVRSVLRVPTTIAQKLCDIAVNQGAIKRLVAVECPDGSEAVQPVEREEDLPPVVTCYSEEDGFMHEVEVPTHTLRKVTFYKLANG